MGANGDFEGSFNGDQVHIVFRRAGTYYLKIVYRGNLKPQKFTVIVG
jgi:hypothetical protein